MSRESCRGKEYVYRIMNHYKLYSPRVLAVTLVGLQHDKASADFPPPLAPTPLSLTSLFIASFVLGAWGGGRVEWEDAAGRGLAD